MALTSKDNLRQYLKDQQGRRELKLKYPPLPELAPALQQQFRSIVDFQLKLVTTLDHATCLSKITSLTIRYKAFRTELLSEAATLQSV